MLTQVRNSIRQKHQVFECLLIFCSCVFIYLANGQLISSNDSIPNTLLAFNWLENHTLHFDAFRAGHYYLPNSVFGPDGIPYFFVEAANGHLTSAYPIGVAVVSFPLYVLFFVYLKVHMVLSDFLNLPTISLNILDPNFEKQRWFFEKLASAILAAFSAVIFYLLARLKFSDFVAWIATFIYAFGTLNWVVCSQGLWPHTVSNLTLLSAMLCLFKANRIGRDQRTWLLLVAGIFCGLLPGVRPSSLLFSIAILLYSILTYRKEAIFVLLGSCSALLNITWNIYYFGFNLRSLTIGGYSKLLAVNSGSYQFTVDYVKEAFWGLLVSPSRGFLVFSPVLLFSIPGICHVSRKLFKKQSDRDETLIAFLSIACLLLFIHYCVYVPWWGAITYGSRFLTDTLPVFCYLICYFLRNLFESPWQNKKLKLGLCTAFFVCLTFSTFTQAVGAFSDNYVWDTAPMFSPSRFWDWRDSQIERHTRNVFLKIEKPIQRPRRYLRGLSGVIKAVKDANNQPILNTLCVSPSQQVVLQADLKNVGVSPWFGYDTGLVRGRTLVKVRFFDSTGQAVSVVSSNLLYVSGAPKTGETTTAIGAIWFPQQVGDYKMTFQLAAEQIGASSNHSPKSVYELDAKVRADNSAASCTR